MAAKRAIKKYNARKAVRKMARERVGTVAPSRPLGERQNREKPKHKKPVGTEDEV